MGEIRTAAKVVIDKPSQAMRWHWITNVAKHTASRAEVQRLARHKSYRTTDAFYVDIETDALEETLRAVPFARVGNAFGNSEEKREAVKST